MKKALISLFIISFLICTVLTISTSATTIVKSGSCGTSVTYTIDSDGLLTISGTGAMSYNSSNAPWYTNRSSIKSVVIENGVTSIRDYAFYGYTTLTSVEISDSVTSIGTSAFECCENLTSIKLPDSITNINLDAFAYTGYYNDSSNWENGVFYIGKVLIDASVAAEDVSVKDGTKTISDGAFNYCKNLKRVDIPDSVTSIGYDAFYDCYNLTSINLGNSITTIGSYAFDGCTSLTSVVIPNSVISIGSYAFNECSSLTSITVPDSVTSIGNSAFYGCLSLTIYGYKVSYAKTYANNNNIPFVALQSYVVTYNANGGNDAPASQNKKPGVNLTLTSNIPTKANHVFKGWSTSADGDVVYTNGATYTTDSDITLWAVWEESLSIEIATKKTLKGKTVSVPVKITNNPGVNAMRVTLNYDRTALELTAVENGDVFVELEEVYLESERPIIITTNALSDTFKTGTAFTLKFKVRNDSPLGDYTINFTYREENDIINIHGDNVSLKIINGSVNVVDDIMPGDANGDGYINMRDALCLRKHLAGWDVYAALSALDVNGDGSVNMKDTLLLFKYLAGYDVELG